MTHGQVFPAVHDPLLVMLSILVSIIAAYVARHLSDRVDDSRGGFRLAWLAGTAVTDGIGIWSMHYTGKLALRLPVPLLFDWRLVLLSLLVSIAAAALALAIVARRDAGWRHVIAGGLVLGGIGISGMHFTAMAAMRLPGMHHRYASPALVVLSVVAAIAVATVALYLRSRPRAATSRGARMASIALVRGSANPIMHFMAMAAVVFVYDGSAHEVRHDVGEVALGIISITFIPALILGAALLTAVIDRIQKQRILLDALFEQTPQAVVLLNAEGCIVCVNREFSRVFGYTPQEAVGHRLCDLIGDSASDNEEHEGVRWRKDRCALQVSMLRVPLSMPNGEDGIYVMLSDITDRKRADEALRMLPRRLIETQETAGKQIALELHDQIGQSLTSVSMMLALIPKLERAAVEERIADARGILDDLINRVRNLALDLRPSILDDFGFEAALQWLAQRFSRQMNLNIELQSTIDSERFRPDVEIAAYRIVQEALTNVARHAQVREATVRIERISDTLHVEITDRGIGFDPDGAQVSVGLAGMAERARSLAGRLSIVCEPDAGTRVTAELPIR